MVGSAISHYRITGKLGEGGMGAVYRAIDTTLGREVAIKILPESFAQTPDRLMRFTREARVLASLNHPNIAAIYGVEDRALVLELVEGPTLEQRIRPASGPPEPIPVAEVLEIARQVAEAMEYAHEKGVIHRDLKPANIKLDAEGRAKVLDFGLAKAIANEPGSGEPLPSPSGVHSDSTITGIVVGTPAYMSPEQAQGKPADRRSDIWAFDVILVEMLTGHRLPLAVLVAAEPDLSGLPAGTPPSIQRLVRRCLERDPKKRLQAIGEARIVIEEVLTPGAEQSPAVLAWQSNWLWKGMAAVLVAAFAGLAILYFRDRPAESPTLRYTIAAPEKTRFPLSAAGGFAVSPDGQSVVFVVELADGKRQLWLRSLDSLTAHPLEGTEGGAAPFWSPTSRSIGFFSGGKLKRVDLAGGPAIRIAAKRK